MAKLDDDPRREWRVYIYFRPWSGEPCYIGKGIGGRWSEHLRLSDQHPNSHFSKIFAKAARLGLEVPVVVIRENLTNEEACIAEIAFIAAIGRSDLGKGPLCNHTDGGEGVVGYERTEADIEKMKVAQLAFRTPEWQAKNNEARLEALKRPETRARMSAASKGRVFPAESNIARRLALQGKKKDPAAVEKVAVQNRGKKRTPEYKLCKAEQTARWWAEHPEARNRGPRPDWVKEKLRVAGLAHYAAKRATENA